MVVAPLTSKAATLYTATDMSATGDRRRRSDLDLFVLALVEEGVSTPYRMQVDAGLSQGATIPTLRRLVAAKWIRQSRPGSRGRMEYRITAAGRRRLGNGWRELIDFGPVGDLDTDLRAALLALFVGGQRIPAAQFLRASADKRQQTIKHAPESSEQPGQSLLAASYQRLRAEAVQSLAEAETTAILTVAGRLPPKPGSRALLKQRS